MYALYVLIAVTLLTAAFAAVEDFRSGEISNRLIAAALIVALPLRAWFEWSSRGAGDGVFDLAVETLIQSGLGAFACALAPFVLFRMGAMGGGDVKLLFALGALLGPVLGLEVELYAFVFAALFAGARLAYAGELFRTFGNAGRLAVNPFLPSARRVAVPATLMTSFRFAPAIFAAALVGLGARWVWA